MKLQSVFILVVALQALGLSAAPRKNLSGHHVPAAVARLGPAANLPGSQHLNLAIGLPLRNEQELDALLQQLYDPASPNYHRYLTPEQFTARFGPADNDYQSLIDFARSNGLTVTVTHPNRVVLDVEGTVADIQNAFHLTLHSYRHPLEAREFYAPDAEPSVDLAVPILHVSGLDNYYLPRPNLKMRPEGAAGKATPNFGSGPRGSYRGNDFRTAYVPGTSLTGAGQSVGLLQFDGFYPNDIATYERQAGLTNVPLTIVKVDGGIATPGTNNVEVALDIEMAISMAPGLAHVYVYEAPNQSPWVDILSRMANDNLSRQLSCSWGDQVPGRIDPNAEQIFRQMAAQGQSFFNATGDDDAFTVGVPFPSDSPNITQVGGTRLTTDTGGNYLSETVWNRGGGTGSGGGISTFYPIPHYQQGISMVIGKGSTIMRNVPDVALTAEDVYVVYGNGTNGAFGGTSCSAPLWAGFTALINQQAAAVGLPPIGFLNPALYTIGKGVNYANAFHDTTNGNNFSATSPNRFSAVPGYDLCTGWGTPNGATLIDLLNRPVPWIISQPQSQIVAAGASATFSVMVRGVAPLSYQWYFNGKPISRATGSSYSIDRVQSIQAGTYTVIVSNASGTVQSDPATLVIASGTGAFGIVGVPFGYQVRANNNPSHFSASGLPSGLHFDPLAGVISGIPTVAGRFEVFVEAKGNSGSTSVAIVVTIAEGEITSATSVFDIVGVPFSYQITADNNPNRFSVSGLPSGLHFDPLGGVIYGIPTVTGRFPVIVETRNDYGTASATVVITIVPGVIISASNADGIIGVPFSYQITADNNPTRFSVSALPSGLHFDPLGGVIYGTPTVTGRFPVIVETRNDYGTASATVIITIVPGAIISATSVSGEIGVPFSYQISADNNPNRFSVSALPSGLRFDTLAGLISGTPNVTGSFSVVVEAKNNYGSASKTIVIIIKDQTIGGGGSQPSLTISRTGDNFFLTWPATFNGYSLEETQLQQSTWTNSSVNVSVQGDHQTALIPIQSTVKFYRLRK